MTNFSRQVSSKSAFLTPLLFVALFFSAFLALGLSIYKDYGFSTDEIFQQQLGYDNYFYLRGANQKLLQNSERYHGPLFTVFATLMEWKLGGGSTQGAFFARHLATFLFFFGGTFFFFLICRRVFRSWKIGLLGCLFLILSPVIFSNAFYNPKDIPFLAVFTVAMFTLTVLLDHPGLPAAFLHGAACAALMAVRIPGILAVAITLALLAAVYLLAPIPPAPLTSGRGNKSPRPLGGEAGGGGITKPSLWRLVGLTAAYLAVTFGGLVAIFPALWSNPLKNFIEALFLFSRYEQWGGQVFYMGQYLTPDQLPWHYIPVWIAITTPLLYTAAFLLGLVSSGAGLLRKPIFALDEDKRTWLVFWMWFFLPLLTVILGHSVVYNGWRHLFFIYPAFIVIALGGLRAVFAWLRAHWNARAAWVLVGGLCLWSAVDSAVFIVNNHPHENVYFNPLAGADMQAVKQRFDMDYWGLSYRSVLEAIARNDPSEHITIYAANSTGKWSARMLPPKDQARISFVDDPQNANYFISDYKDEHAAHPQEYDYSNEFFAVKVGDAKIAVAYHLR
jgi:hypothetical protein